MSTPLSEQYLFTLQVGLDTIFIILSNDNDPVTSMSGRAKALGTINYEIGTSLAERIPRYFVE